MKKEFKAPVIEAKELTTDNVMAAMLISTEGVNGAHTFVVDAQIKDDYNMWKSVGE